MNKKPTYEELEQRVKELEKTLLKCNPAEEALIESEKLYRLIVENVTDIICIVDMEMKFTYFSPSVKQMRGYSVEEAMAQSVEEAMTPASFESAMKMIAEELELHDKRERDPTRSRKMEAELTCKDGSTVWTEIESNFVYNSEGQPVGILGITRNITERKESEKERKRAQEALRESEERFRTLIELSPTGVFLTDAEGQCTYWNPCIAKFTGLSPVEAQGDGWVLGVHEEDRERSFAEWTRCCRERIPYNIESRYVDREGRSTWVIAQAVELTDSKDRITGYMGTTTDITERKQAEEVLRESEQKYRQLFATVSDAIVVFDAEKKQFVDVNVAALHLYGYSKEEFLKLKLPSITAEPEKSATSLNQVLSDEIKGVPLRHHKKKDGTIFPVEISTGSFKSGDRKMLCGAIRDITERKQAEKVVCESEEKFRNLFNNAEVGMFRTRLDGSEILEMNEKFLNIFGRTREEEQGSPSVIHWADPSEREEIVRRLEIEGCVQNFECRILNKQGVVRTCLTSLRLYRDQGILEGSIVDITEQKRLEKELLRVQKLESVGLLAGGIAHDFNNILTTILGNISLAKNQIKPDDEIFDLLNEAEMASAKAQTLTKQLLTFAKGGAPVKETASIKNILKESSSFVLRGSKSSCEFSITEDLWPVDADIGQMSQVINNIVINANQAMPGGGTIQVAAENLIIDDRHGLPVKPGRYIRVSIKDQGVGIAEKHLLNIFDPYFTTKQEGSGLGLATTYSIIKKHDGDIAVESQLGVGTTFHIYLHASDKEVPEKEEVKLIKGHGRILVMDDESSLRKIVGRMLDKLGYESDFAKDGAEAIRMVKEAKESGKPYDAVILDLTIPGGMGGKEAIQKLLEIDPEVKAIVSSGYSDDPVLANFKEYGLKGMMPKPFESLSLGKVLHEVLKGEK